MRTVGIWTCTILGALAVCLACRALADVLGSPWWLFPCGCVAGSLVGPIWRMGLDASTKQEPRP